MSVIPHAIPAVGAVSILPPVVGAADDSFGTYDVSIAGIGFRYASDGNQPMQWQTAPYTRNQIDQASEAGEQTLSNWWLKSQSSFHGGAGNLNLERVDLPPAYTHIRFDQSKNVDVWTPGVVQRLPDTTTVTSQATSVLVPLNVGGADTVALLAGTTPKLCALPAGTLTTLTGVTEAAYSLTTDGKYIYVAGATGVWKVNPATPTAATKIATYASSTTPVVSWEKARLMLGFDGGIYELDINGSAVVVDTTATAILRYQHPTAGWTWRCFASSLPAILAAGDCGNGSEVVEFAVSVLGATPVLTVQSTAAKLPDGERVLAMKSTLGSFLALGTTQGVRICTLGDLYSDTRITIGPLTLPTTETQFPVSALAARDRFIYLGGLAVDEPGLLRVDLGTQTDQPGRHAYATDLIAPTQSAATPVTAVCVLPSGKLLFSVPTVGLCIEGAGPGTVRDAWLRTSRIRYGTTEPKLFKIGTLRGDLSTGVVQIYAEKITGETGLTLVGFTPDSSADFALPAGAEEWLALRFQLQGAVTLTSYQVKALPGTTRQRLITATLAAADSETNKYGRRSTERGSARARVEALFAADRAGDEVLFEEFTSTGTVRTLVVIEKALYMETGRPTKTSDFGGTLTVQMRTIA